MVLELCIASCNKMEMRMRNGSMTCSGRPCKKCGGTVRNRDGPWAEGVRTMMELKTSGDPDGVAWT